MHFLSILTLRIPKKLNKSHSRRQFLRTDRYAHSQATVFTLYKYGIRNNFKTDFVVLCTRQAGKCIICVHITYIYMYNMVKAGISFLFPCYAKSGCTNYDSRAQCNRSTLSAVVIQHYYAVPIYSIIYRWALIIAKYQNSRIHVLTTLVCVIPFTLDVIV